MIRWAIVMGVVAACVGYLVYSASGGASEYYVTVSELRSHQPTSGDVRVAGVVQDDIQRSDGGLHVRFTEKDGTASVVVDAREPGRERWVSASGPVAILRGGEARSINARVRRRYLAPEALDGPIGAELLEKIRVLLVKKRGPKKTSPSEIPVRPQPSQQIAAS